MRRSIWRTRRKTIDFTSPTPAAISHRSIQPQVHPQQTPFARKLDKVIGIQAVGSFVFVVEDVLGTTEIRHYTFAADGRQISVKDLSRGGEEFRWSSINSRIYYVQQGVSPANLSWESIDRNTGAITQLRDSPYHGDFAMQHPARVSRDGGFRSARIE